MAYYAESRQNLQSTGAVVQRPLLSYRTGPGPEPLPVRPSTLSGMQHLAPPQAPQQFMAPPDAQAHMGPPQAPQQRKVLPQTSHRALPLPPAPDQDLPPAPA
eukprot:CAMPEP_0180643780 /NCGR_PEP_ID=MMETSP1037_2-20121125/48019_1 /TAXON_ID=632150 /ORGANISM="Azadinium spinosum, Strain 3D9" /LENGTH=101 /DNA_ID=CAMNT_0022667355 /DNA_START=140 /DNA_END=442 /DNA_ORIENTATION=+